MHGTFRFIDADLHIMEPPGMWERYLDKRFQHLAPRNGLDRLCLTFADGVVAPTYRHQTPEATEGWSKFQSDWNHRLADQRASNFDAASQLRAMDAEGIDKAVLFPTHGIYAISRDDHPPAFAAALCNAYNNWLADFCGENRDRLFGAALLPLQDVGEAVTEAKRVHSNLGMRAVIARAAPVCGRSLGDRAYDPLWEYLSEARVPLALHEAYGSLLRQTGEDRYHTIAERRAVVHPMEQMMACMSLILGGALERWPNLVVAFFESGASWVPYWLTRLDEHAETFAHELGHLTMKPSQYFKRQCYVSTECEDHTVKYAVDYLGSADRVVFSTDYPHQDSKFPEATKVFLSNPGLSEDDKRKILWQNPASLYRF